MRKYILAIVAAAMFAAPALAETKMIAANFSGVSKHNNTIIGVGGVALIAFQNKVDVFDPSSNSILHAFTVHVPLGLITDMVFVPPSFLTVQGAGPYAVTIDYSTVPPTILSKVPL